MGHLGLHPALWEADVNDFVSEAYAQGHYDPGAELPIQAKCHRWTGDFLPMYR